MTTRSFACALPGAALFAAAAPRRTRPMTTPAAAPLGATPQQADR
ncbi:hypothetical protein [Amycolatopsis sp. NPDC051371]